MTTHDLTQRTAMDQMCNEGKEEMEEDRRLAAYHEAGHAALLWFFGDHFEIEYLEVREKEWGYGGGVKYHGGELSPVLRIDMRSPEQAKPNAMKIMMHYLAGPFAEARASGDDAIHLFENLMLFRDLYDGSDDIPRATFAADMAARMGFNPDTLLKRAARCTGEALSDVSVWQVVEAIAGRLLVTDRIEVDEACGIIDTVSPPAVPPAYRGKWKRRFRMNKSWVMDRQFVDFPRKGVPRDVTSAALP